MPKRKSQPKPIKSLDHAAVERLLQFFGVLDPDPAAKLPIAVPKISDSDLAQWLANNDKEAMRAAITAFFDKQVAAKKKAEKVAKAKAARKANEEKRRQQVFDVMATLPDRPVTQEEHDAALDRLRRFRIGEPYPK